jgi:hypothetical protein
MVGLTPADRRWMDDIVHTVEETYDSVSYLPPMTAKLTYSLMDNERREPAATSA